MIAKLIAIGICGIFYYQIIFIKADWIFLDYLNIAYHEAGHLFFSFGPEWLHFLGGTLGQILMPLMVAIHFFLKGDSCSGAIILFWVFENFINISRYVRDAYDMELPLVGGHIHDWNWLLTHFGKLDGHEIYADRFYVTGQAGMTISLILASYYLIFSRKQTEEVDY